MAFRRSSWTGSGGRIRPDVSYKALDLARLVSAGDSVFSEIVAYIHHHYKSLKKHRQASHNMRRKVRRLKP